MTRIHHLVLLFSHLILAGNLSAKIVHKVQAGDSLWGIANEGGISVEELKAANGMTSDTLRVGVDLVVPAPRPATATPEPTPQIQPSRPQPAVTSPPQNSAPPLSNKRLKALQLQVTLDRAGFSPGVIDGYSGKFTDLAKLLCEAWQPSALRSPVAPTRIAQIQASWKTYVNPALPGSGSAPDFKALTAKKETMLYYSALEYLAERFHCSEALLKTLNPGVDLKQPQAGASLVVPNVQPFEIERYFNAKGEGMWSDLLGKGSKTRNIIISVPDSLLTVWEDGQLMRAYPITMNQDDSPRGKREIGTVTPGPTYMRKKTELDLFAGPNSPVGIVWCPLGNGFGIHGTSNPDSIGRSVSSGCIRLANWDAVRFGGLIRKGTQVMISEREKAYTPGE